MFHFPFSKQHIFIIIIIIIIIYIVMYAVSSKWTHSIFVCFHFECMNNINFLHLLPMFFPFQNNVFSHNIIIIMCNVYILCAIFYKYVSPFLKQCFFL